MPTYLASKFQQRPTGPTLCLFHASANDILGWADIDRMGPTNTTGIQRGKNSYKINAIKSFFTVDAINTIPTAVVIAIQGATTAAVGLIGGAEGANQLVRLDIPAAADGVPKPGLVIDGQHRLLGIQAFDGDLHIPIVALLDANDDEKAFQFVVINNKVSKVDPTHIKALRLTYDEGVVSTRLNKVRLQIGMALSSVKIADIATESPFKGMVDWELNEQGARKVQPTAIEAAITHIMQHGGKTLEDKELAEQFFFSMWSVIRDTYPKAWSAPQKDSALCRKVGVVCLTTFLTDSLASFNRVSPTPIDLGDAAAVEAQVTSVLKYVPEDFWMTPWNAKSLDTGAGRKLVIDALESVTDNMRAGLAWESGVSIVDIAQKPDSSTST
jgi:DGQHR domain-containing protein